ncbi:MAG: hypothetical protein QOI57_1669 [Rubrobacteraceae bacterium]|jgi:hypothetical protein|nr:hypothetical protein [Rubrobacteraceae bacterium]
MSHTADPDMDRIFREKEPKLAEGLQKQLHHGGVAWPPDQGRPCQQRSGMVKPEKETAGMPEYGTVLNNPSFTRVDEGAGILGYDAPAVKLIRR